MYKAVHLNRNVEIYTVGILSRQVTRSSSGEKRYYCTITSWLNIDFASSYYILNRDVEIYIFFNIAWTSNKKFVTRKEVLL